MLFFGTHGIGPYCYGCGCAEGSAASPSCTPTADCPEYCYDPADGSKGTHSYPYRHQVWAYDANDLVRVIAGTLQSSDVQPYAIWRMDEMDTSGSASMAGAAYDPDSNRLYIAENYGEEPHVHVYRVAIPEAGVREHRRASANPTTQAPETLFDLRGRTIQGATNPGPGLILRRQNQGRTTISF